MTSEQKESFCRAFYLEPSKVLFINDNKDPIYLFWQMVKKQVLPEKCLIVIPDLPPSAIVQDLACYEGTRIGKGLVFNYDVVTNPGVKPSQRGLFRR